MDSIKLAERIFRIIRTRQTQLIEIITNNQVKDWNEQELSDLLKKQEQND